MINGIERVAITKLDVLSNLDEIKVCIAYELDGKVLESFPTTVNQLERIVPIYKTLPGWKTDITDIKKYEDLPIETKNYLSFISEHSGFEISIILGICLGVFWPNWQYFLDQRHQTPRCQRNNNQHASKTKKYFLGHHMER